MSEVKQEMLELDDFMKAIGTKKSRRTMAYYCQVGWIKGAVKNGREWLIPVETVEIVKKEGITCPTKAPHRSGTK